MTLKSTLILLTVLVFSGFAKANIDSDCAMDSISNRNAGSSLKQKLTPQPRTSESCLSGDTMISTPNGSVPISNLKLHDKVLSLNSEGKVVIGTVNATFTHFNKKICDLRLADNSILKVTPNHPMIYISDKSISSNEFKSSAFAKMKYEAMGFLSNVFNNGDSEASFIKLHDSSNTSVVPTKAVSYSNSSLVDVYNIEVIPFHNYFANGVLVHNKSDGGGG